VIDFVNTLDLEVGTDELTDPDGLVAWLRRYELIGPHALVVRAAQHARAIELREALRDTMVGHNGGGADAAAVAILEQTAEHGRLAVRFCADGSVSLEPRADGFAGALARLLAPVARAAADGSWERVKACRANDCRWAFYDQSRNRSARWCDMAVCGNRTKVRAYRRRRW
jgi:predicted RNA-binding Zn ribbon-like protein